MTFKPKSFAQIVADMTAEISARTPINDFTPNSVVLTLLEAAAQEDAQQYIQMIEILRNYSLDTTEGSDLDKKAFEFGIKRKAARPHSGYVTIKDNRFNTISTKLYAGLSGPSAGSSQIFVDDASEIPANGTLYVGRGTVNAEGPIAYSAAPVDNTAFWTITLDTALINDHGTDETVVLGQYGLRQVRAGTEVRIPENDFSPELIFELNQTVELQDGVDTVDSALITALLPGGPKVPRGSIREFVNPPFSGASVYNFAPFINGRDVETDQELRDNIRQTIQSLSRGTGVAVKNSVLGIIDPDSNSSITSANVIPPTELADGPTKVYIDNGRGLEPEVATFGLETLQTSASGGEIYFQLSQFPLIKASILSQLVAPFNLVGGEFLTLRVGTNIETFVFASSDFTNLGAATASEIAEAINNRATLFESRSTTDASGSRILITPKISSNEDVALDEASTANAAFNFTTRDIFTLKLYKNDQLLTKDGTTGTALSLSDPFDFSSTEYTTADDASVVSGSTIISKTGSADDFRVKVKAGDYVKSDEDTDNFYVKVKMVVSANKLILESKYPAGSSATSLSKLVIWSAPQIEVASNGDYFDTEIVSFSKNDFVTPAQATSPEVYARLQKDLNLSKSGLAVNNRKVSVQSYLENSVDSKVSISGGHGALAMGFTSKYSLTGTITVDASSNVISGSGTLFTSQLKEGQWIKRSLDGAGAWTKVLAIESNTLAYLETPYNGNTGAGSAAEAIQPSVESVGSNKDYTLNRSNGQIELAAPLVAGDSLTAGSINTRAFSDSVGQPFDFSSLGSFSTLIVRVDGGIGINVTTGDSVAPYASITDVSLAGYPAGSFVGYQVACTSGSNVGATSNISNYNAGTGRLDVTTGFVNPISVGDVFVLSQVMEFTHSSDFADDSAASAAEVAAAINKKLIGASAQVILGNKVRVRTNNLDQGSLQIIGGSANLILGFATSSSANQEANIAYAISSSSDRDGLANALGYTLSPAQSLVVVVDDDNVNKTFSTLTRIEAAVTTGAAGSFTSSVLASKYPLDATLQDFWLYWKTGVNAGRLQIATGHVGSTGTITYSEFYPTGSTALAPVAGDVCQLVPRTAENLVTLLTDLNTTVLSIPADISVVGNTGDYVQISTKRPGTSGKVFVRGGTANSLAITVQSPVPGAPINDIFVNSIAGLAKGLPVNAYTTSTLDVVYVSNITGSTAPYTVSLNNADGTPFDVAGLTLNNNALLKDVNGLRFPTSQIEGIDGYKFYEGLIKLAQWSIDGLDRDLSNYPGIGAAGTQFEVLAPVLKRLRLIVNITPVDGVSLSSISNTVASKIMEYVNSRKVGEDVILSEIITAAQSVTGVYDAKISNLTDNVIIADGELVRLANTDLIVG